MNVKDNHKNYSKIERKEKERVGDAVDLDIYFELFSVYIN
jgi:hypothetical protein